MSVALDLKWMDESMKQPPRLSIIYRLVRWMLGKKNTQLSYKDLYLIGIGLRKRMNQDQAREEALQAALTQYKIDNGHIPEGWEEYVEVKKRETNKEEKHNNNE